MKLALDVMSVLMFLILVGWLVYLLYHHYKYERSEQNTIDATDEEWEKTLFEQEDDKEDVD